MNNADTAKLFVTAPLAPDQVAPFNTLTALASNLAAAVNIAGPDSPLKESALAHLQMAFLLARHNLPTNVSAAHDSAMARDAAARAAQYPNPALATGPKLPPSGGIYPQTFIKLDSPDLIVNNPDEENQALAAGYRITAPPAEYPKVLRKAGAPDKTVSTWVDEVAAEKEGYSYTA